MTEFSICLGGAITSRHRRAALQHGFDSAVRDSACRSGQAARRQVIDVRRMHIEHTAVFVDVAGNKWDLLGAR